MMSAEREVAFMTDVPDEVQRWTAKRKTAVVLSIVKGETSAAEAARKHGLTIAEIERWKEQFFAAGENALRARPRDEEAAKDEQIERLKRKVGELVPGIDILGGGELSMTTQSCRSVTIQRCRSRTATSPPLQAFSCSVPPPLSWSRRPRSRHEGPLMVSTSALCSSRSRIAAASASSPNSGAHSAMLLFEVMSIEP